MSEQAANIYEFGDFRLDCGREVLSRAGEDIPLTPKVYSLLLAFLENPGRLLEKDELIKLLWEDSFVEEANLNVNVSALRRVLGERPNEDRYIVTVPRRGYRFVAEVRSVAEDGLKNDTETPPVTASGDPVATTFPARPRTLALLGGAAVLLIFVITAAAFYLFRYGSSSSPEASSLRTIAVLPFRPLSGEGEPALQIGMSDALITRLGALKQIRVRPTSSISKYAGIDFDPVAAGKEQQVEAVLDGKLQHIENRIRITVQLIRVSDGNVLWSNSFDDYFTNIFAVQDSISEKVMSSLSLTLSGQDKQRLAKRSTENTEAYSLYLQGRYYHETISREGSEKALVYYKAAVEKDPDYAVPYAAMVGAYMHLVHLKIDPENNLRAARTAAARAIEIDPNLAEAHAALASMKHVFDWDFPGAEAEFKRAIELDPNSYDPHYSYSILLTCLKRHDEAIREMTAAQQLYPTAQFILNEMTLTYFRAGKFEEGLANAHRASVADPNDRVPHQDLVLGNLYLGRIAEAREEMTRFAISDKLRDRLQAEIDFHTSDRAKGEKYFRKLISDKADSTSHSILAAYYSKIGDNEHALQELQAAYAERDGLLVLIAVQPEFMSLRSDPRFVDLIRKIGLPV